MKLIIKIILSFALIIYFPITLAQIQFDLGVQKAAAPAITEKMIQKSQKKAVQNAEELFHLTSDPIIGNAEGTVTLVEFMDFACPRCEGIDPLVQELIQENPHLRVVYKEYPIKGAVSVFAAKAALAAKLQGKYQPFHVALMREGKKLTSQKILEIAKEVGLNIEQLKDDMDSTAIDQQIRSTNQLAKQIGIMGTPALFFAKTNVSSNEDPEAILFMMGQFDKEELQKGINKFSN